MELFSDLKRTDYCGNFRAADAGKEITVFGWVQRARNLGSLLFIELRDRTGLLQLAFDEHTAPEVFEKAASVRSEYVLAAVGTVRERSAKTDKIATGDIEVAVTDLRILSKSASLSVLSCSSAVSWFTASPTMFSIV